MRLHFSGYSVQFIKKILRSTMKAHSRIQEKSSKWCKTPVQKETLENNIAAEGEKRKERKLVQWLTWLQICAFCTNHEGLALKKMYGDVVSKKWCRVKLVERTDTSIEKMLQKSHPFENAKCEDKCFVCLSEGSGSCRSCNVSYEILFNTRKAPT